MSLYLIMRIANSRPMQAKNLSWLILVIWRLLLWFELLNALLVHFRTASKHDLVSNRRKSHNSMMSEFLWAWWIFKPTLTNNLLIYRLLCILYNMSLSSTLISTCHDCCKSSNIYKFSAVWASASITKDASQCIVSALQSLSLWCTSFINANYCNSPLFPACCCFHSHYCHYQAHLQT
jgi:hypothetical protein